MTPMIDVTFQLIIFFLLSSRLAQQEAIELELPAAASGAVVDEDQRPRLTVNVSAAGEVSFGSAPTSPQEMAGRLQFERDRWGADLEIRIRADRSVPYGAIEPILLACADKNIWNVTFAVLEKTETP
jgi:biopolymer transport protein ExbD